MQTKVMNHVLYEPLSIDACLQHVMGVENGAVVIFLGVVRNHTLFEKQKKNVSQLHYEMHEAMLEFQCQKFIQETLIREPSSRLMIHHRGGTLNPGEISVVIAAGAHHRAQAFEVCSQAIEWLKQHGAIWKREFGEDGVSWVGMGS